MTARATGGAGGEAFPLAEEAALLLDRLREEPIPEEPRNAAALRRATQAAFVILKQTRTLAERRAREPRGDPMTGKGQTGRNRRVARPTTIRGVAAAAARLLDRLREEPLPEDAAAGVALRIATRNAFLLVQETRLLAAEKAPVSAISHPATPNRNRKNRPFFLFSGEPEEDRDDRAAVDLEAHRERVRRLAIAARRRA